MSIWYTEEHTKHARFSIEVKKPIWSEKTEFQEITIFDSYEFGRVLVLDDCIMLSEKDEFVYHEMLSHLPLAVNPEIKSVLIIGGGDGGIARELLAYPGIKDIDLVEIDQRVIELSKQYLPFTSSSFASPKVKVHIADGLRFVRTKVNHYDLIVVDSTDPFGPGESLFTREFYGNCYKALTEQGILVNQHESPYYEDTSLEMQDIFAKTSQIFKYSYVYQAHIPTYPSGHWLFGFASKALHPLRDLKPAAFESLNLDLGYYNLKLHQGAFALPTAVLAKLNEVRSK